MNLSGKIQVVSQTHTGMKRSHNEDCIGTDINTGLVALADGMGGYKAGEVASALAINTIVSDIAERIEKLIQVEPNVDNGGYSPESVLLQQVVIKSNTVIHQTAQAQPQYQGMGTTVVLAMFYDNKVSISHVGDSRAYRIRNNHLEQLTVDHTLLQELVERGFYTPEEARKSMNKNLVTRALGIDPAVDVDTLEEVVLKGDVFLLCSDGLNDMLDDQEILLTLKENADNLDAAAKSLIDNANAAGGNDNVSVILVKILELFPASQSWYKQIIDWF